MPTEVVSPISRRGGKPGSIHRGDQSEPQEQPEVRVRPETHVHMEALEQPEERLGDQSEPEEPRAAADADISSGQDLGRADPAHLRQFEELLGIRIFGGPNVPGASAGVVGPEDD
jgi:hypothetical protein